jgi:stage IV sporulation protein A
VEGNNILRDIAERTGGDIYLGVVGPVRTGKSTFVKRFMELMVIPNIKNAYDRERSKDELPMSGAGRTVTTTEPKFVPNEAVEISLRNGLGLKVRLIDCVGYTVPGALGYEEGEMPRMVSTPWFDYEIPFEEAAEVGTRKVITDHSTIGLVVITDGSITDIPRESYREAEERVVNELREIDKPFVVVLNSTRPYALETVELAERLAQSYNVPVIPVDAANMTGEDVYSILEEVLYEFPVQEINIKLPRWVDELSEDFWLRDKLETSVRAILNDVHKVRDIDTALEKLGDISEVESVTMEEMNLGTGIASMGLVLPEDLYYQVLAEISGFAIEGDTTCCAL